MTKMNRCPIDGAPLRTWTYAVNAEPTYVHADGTAHRGLLELAEQFDGMAVGSPMWRVRACDPPRHSVQVGGHELALAAADVRDDRVDVIALRLQPIPASGGAVPMLGAYAIEALVGPVGHQPPLEIPPDRLPIARVSVPACATAIFPGMIEPIGGTES